MSVHTYIRQQCHPLAHLHIFREEDLERVREPPPSAQAVCAAFLSLGCTEVVEKTPALIVGTTKERDKVIATGTASGWLLTGGPRNLLSYGVPDASALERFPDVLASVQEHARHLDHRATR